MVKTSFIIIAYNEEKNIANCINSILHQGGLRDHEIVVVNDGSKDKTAEIINNFSKRNKNIRLIDFKENKGRGFARFTGVKESKGDCIAFIDADIILPKHWLKTCLSEIKNYDAVGGLAVPDGDVNYIWRKCNLKPRIVGHSTEITGNNGFYKKFILNKINYDFNLKDGEDFDLNIRLKKSGFKIKSINNLIVEHRESKSYLKSLGWLYQSGKGATRLFKKYHKIRIPDLAFFGFIIVLISSLFLSFKINFSYISLILIYPLLTSFLHLFSKFEINNIFNFISAILFNYFFILSYYWGRIIGFLKNE